MLSPYSRKIKLVPKGEGLKRNDLSVTMVLFTDDLLYKTLLSLKQTFCKISIARLFWSESVCQS